MTTNTRGLDDVQSALRAEGITFDTWQTEGPGYATTLAQRATSEATRLSLQPAATAHFTKWRAAW
jgi:hypothetical protein